MIREGRGVRQGVFIVPPFVMPHATHHCAAPCCATLCHAAPHQHNPNPCAALYAAAVPALLPLIDATLLLVPSAFAASPSLCRIVMSSPVTIVILRCHVARCLCRATHHPAAPCRCCVDHFCLSPCCPSPSSCHPSPLLCGLSPCLPSSCRPSLCHPLPSSCASLPSPFFCGRQLAHPLAYHPFSAH